MKLNTQVVINAPREVVWNIVSDIENCKDTISAIEKIDILEKPDSGMTGLKWKEQRTLFGKTATETMWVTDSKENEFYKTRAESHGSIYETMLSLKDGGEGTLLNWEFAGSPQTFGAKLMSVLMGWMFKGSMRKALEQDLADIKAKAESLN